jgi:stage IV sporulation protein FB
MTWSFPVGRLFGSEIRIHATFFLLLLWIGAAAWMEGGLPAALSNVAFILALFACVVAHEFGHALTARRYGIATPDITLLPIGGLARLDRMPEKPGQEILVALAGPAVNVAIWAVLVIVLGAETRLDNLAAIEDAGTSFLGRLAAVNLFLALFNLLPAFPMDGGRVFRAVLSIPFGRIRATRIAAMGGQALAFLFGFLGLTSGNPVLVLIAIFVFIAASAESSDVMLRSLTRDVPARAAMITNFVSLAPDDSIQAASDSLLRTTQGEFPVVAADGRLAGILTRAAIFQALANGRPDMRVDEAMAPDVPSVILGAPLEDALNALSTSGAPAVAVTDPRGVMLGFITRENIGEWVVIAGTKRR